MTERKHMEQNRIENAINKSKRYIDSLTIDSKVNRPKDIVSSPEKFFTWDNEKRNYLQFGLLFDWSYYTGVVMEGLYDIYEADKTAGGKYLDYIEEYFDSLLGKDENGNWQLVFERAGYVDCHGADCYKTAALLCRMAGMKESYRAVAEMLYKHLTDTDYINSLGCNIPSEYTGKEFGHNYWHCWKKPPKYKIWLDGIYMLQPFIAHQAALLGDEAQLSLVNERLDWVADTLLAPCGMYYHAANSKEDVCGFFWLRAMGWYGMAMVDVMEVLPEKYIEGRKRALKLFADGMLKYVHENGLWANLADREVTETNRLETSGTAMMCYTLLKGVRNGWLDASYREAGIRAFVAMAEEKLDENGLHDIYLRASASNTNNYEKEEFYMTDEGKGSGPFIMAYSEMLYLQA